MRIFRGFFVGKSSMRMFWRGNFSKVFFWVRIFSGETRFKNSSINFYDRCSMLFKQTCVFFFAVSYNWTSESDGNLSLYSNAGRVLISNLYYFEKKNIWNLCFIIPFNKFSAQLRNVLSVAVHTTSINIPL